MQIAFGILYLLVGILLAIPYCFLAGWNTGSFVITVFVAPAFLFIWFILATFAGIIESGRRKTVHFNWRAAFSKSDRLVLSSFLPIFWAWTLYIFLPIILHSSAVLLGEIGFEAVSLFLYTHRYASLLCVFMATLIMFILIAMVTSVWDVAKNMLTRIVQR